MTVKLVVHDGSPLFYLSPDIWTVPCPGNVPNHCMDLVDPTTYPNVPAGVPTASDLTYVWARVFNNGDEAAADVTVWFRWASPNVGFDLTHNSYSIGTGFVSSIPGGGGHADVVCATPWKPTYTNGGHICLIVAAFCRQDLLDTTLPFNVVRDEKIAQLNLNIYPAPPGAMFHGLIEVYNAASDEQNFFVEVHEGVTDEIDPRVIENLGLTPDVIKTPGRLIEPAIVERLTTFRRVEKLDVGATRTEILLGPRQSTALRVSAALDGRAALLCVTQFADGVPDPVGGAAYLLLDDLDAFDLRRPRKA